MIFYHLYYRTSTLKLNLVLRYPSLTECITENFYVETRRGLFKKAALHSTHLLVESQNQWKRGEICSKLTIKTLQRCFRFGSGVFIVSFEHISQLFLSFYCWLWRSNCLLVIDTHYEIKTKMWKRYTHLPQIFKYKKGCIVWEDLPNF